MLVWTRPKSEDEVLYNKAQNILSIYNEQRGLANIGDPALLAFPGGLGNTIRLLTVADGSGQLGTGIYQEINGDTWNAAGNIALGALKVTGGIEAQIGIGSNIAKGGYKPVIPLGYDSNKISHIFVDKHQMSSLVKEFGSPEAALKEMHKTAQFIEKIQEVTKQEAG